MFATMFRNGHMRALALWKLIKTHAQALAVAALLLVSGLYVAAPQYSAAAQTPVPIVVDTNAIFTQTNNWITVFAPIVAIGVGIAIALAILTFIGNQILKAFRGGGAR